jgi:hypothetical protein
MTNTTKFPITVIFFIISLIVCTVIRYLQYSAVILSENGFFAHDGGFLNRAYHTGFAGAAVIMLITILIDKKRKCSIRRCKAGGITIINELHPAQAVIGAVLTAACGFLLAIDAVASIAQSAPIMLTITLILAALGYTFIAFIIITDRRISPITAIGFLFIAACCVCTAALEFMARTFIANLSARLVILSVNVLLALFFLNCGRIVVRNETRLTAITAALFGYSAVLLIISDSIARVLYYYSVDAFSQNNLINSDNGFGLPSAVFIIQAAVVLWFIFTFSMKRKYAGDDVIVAQENEEKDEIEIEIPEIPAADGDTVS